MAAVCVFVCVISYNCTCCFRCLRGLFLSSFWFGVSNSIWLSRAERVRHGRSMTAFARGAVITMLSSKIVSETSTDLSCFSVLRQARNPSVSDTRSGKGGVDDGDNRRARESDDRSPGRWNPAPAALDGIIITSSEGGSRSKKSRKNASVEGGGGAVGTSDFYTKRKRPR